MIFIGIYFYFVQDKVYKEITEVLGEKDKYIDVNDVNKMEYLDQCIKETLRLFPPIPFTLRLATNDFKISELNLYFVTFKIYSIYEKFYLSLKLIIYISYGHN